MSLDLAALLAASRAGGDRSEWPGSAKEWLVATVVAVRGSSYRTPGARMIVDSFGRSAGTVSGGCLEKDIVRCGYFKTDRGPSIVTYDARLDREEGDGPADWPATGLGCDGAIDVLLERARESDPLSPAAAIEDAVARDAESTLGVVVRTGAADVPLYARARLRRGVPLSGSPDAAHGLPSDVLAAVAAFSGPARRILLRGGHVELFCERVVPPPHLFVFGAGADVVPLATIARAAGILVTVVSRTGGPSMRARFHAIAEVVVAEGREATSRVSSFSRALAVVMSHDYEADRETLGALLESDVSYIGVLGPRRRTERMLRELGKGADACAGRLFAPVGLDLGAETPGEVALSIAAELQAWLAGGTGSSLRTKDGPIHEWTPLGGGASEAAE